VTSTDRLRWIDTDLPEAAQDLNGTESKQHGDDRDPQHALRAVRPAQRDRIQHAAADRDPTAHDRDPVAIHEARLSVDARARHRRHRHEERNQRGHDPNDLDRGWKACIRRQVDRCELVVLVHAVAGCSRRAAAGTSERHARVRPARLLCDA
jgi:hypothetical protein